jgi:hypothetical protein
VLGQGGIPNAGLTAGGKVVSIRMEHVWVEAFVDFVPSRAAKHIAGDSWVPLDASYKQYDYTSGYDLATQVPFDAEALLNDLQASATVNEAEGWVQNIDQALIEQRFEQYRAQVESYINNQDPEATVGEVLGTRNTIVYEPMELAAGLPYRVEATTARYAAIPNALRHQYTVSLAERTALAQASGETVFSVTMPLSRAANHAVALSFVPATEQDEQVLLGYLPDGDTTDPANLPTELPGYLINMRAQLTLDGEVIAEGGSFALGTELEIAHRFTDPRRSIPVVRSIVVAGEYHAIGVDSGQVNPQLLTKTKAQLEQAKTELEAIQGQLDNNQTPTISDFLTKHTLTGNLLQAGVMNYFAENDFLDLLEGKALGVTSYRMQSVGVFSTSMNVTYLYGVPTTTSAKGISADMDLITTLAVSRSDDSNDVVAFFIVSGTRKSALESLIPGDLLSSAWSSAETVSTTRMLARAMVDNQKIYAVSRQDSSFSEEIESSGSVISDIRGSLAMNRSVLVHEKPMSFAGNDVFGYVVRDSTTGAGAYKISVGTNGGGSSAEEKDNMLLAAVGMLPSSGNGFKNAFVSLMKNQSVRAILGYMLFNSIAAFFGTLMITGNVESASKVFLASLISGFVLGVVLAITLHGNKFRWGADATMTNYISILAALLFDLLMKSYAGAEAVNEAGR